MTKKEFAELTSRRLVTLDGATGSNLTKAGMPKGVCTEEWALDHPEAVIELQRRYIEAAVILSTRPPLVQTAPA